MNAAILVICLWAVNLVCSIVLAGLHLAHRKAAGVNSGMIGVFGALLTWGYVSACLGVLEQSNYLFSTSFLPAIGVGIIGSVCFFKSCFRLTNDQDEDVRVPPRPKIYVHRPNKVGLAER